MKNISYKRIMYIVISLTGFLMILVSLAVGFLNVESLYKFDYILISIGAVLMCSPLVINKLIEIDFKKRTAKFDQSTVEKFKDDVVGEIRSSIHDIAIFGSEHMDHSKAFEIAKGILKEYSDTEEVSNVDLKLISVALCYSWDFIENDFVEVARKNRNVKYSWKIAIVDPKYLNDFKFDRKEYDWKKQSTTIIDRIKKLEKKLYDEGVTNVSFEIFIYRSIPQWHGLLIDRKYLLVGRSDWELTTESGYPRLTVGSNAYRYYNYTESYGQFKINLFRHWFGFYANFSNLFKGESC